MTIQRINNAELAVAARIVEIQQVAYAVEAALMSFDALPPLQDTVADVQSYGELTWHGAFDGDVIAGVLAWSDQQGTIDIDRLAIDPAYARRGYGRALLRSLPQDLPAQVSTGTANLPAVGLYESEGFQLQGTTEIAPGVSVSHFSRPPVAPLP